MTTIRLLDARRGLNLKCIELFRDEKIADAIYRYLCDGIEECEDAEPERKTGEWISKGYGEYRCSSCREIVDLDTEILMSIKSFDYCPYCGSYNGGK